MTRQQLIQYIIASLTIVGTLVGLSLYVGSVGQDGFPEPITVDGKTIEFTWTDDNTGEDILLYTDKQTYTGLSEAEVYVAVVNTAQSQEVTFNGLFGRSDNEISAAYVLTTVVEDIDVVTGSTETCRDEMQTSSTTGKKGKVSVCTTEPVIETQRETHNEWAELPLQPRNEVEELVKLAGNSRKESDGYTTDTSLKYTIDKGEVLYLKLLISYPANTSGNFFFEAIGENGSTGHLDPWFDASWDYRVKVTVDDAKVPSTQSSFPVYVDLSDLPADFFTNAKSDGCDIRLVESDETTETAFELVSYDAGGTGELHFMADSLTGSGGGDTEFWVYYGNSGASCYATTATYGAENVWVNYIMVHHMTGASVTALDDSTSNSNDFTAENGSFSGTYNSTGQLGDALSFNQDNAYVYISDSASLDISGPDITLSAWFNTDLVGSNGSDSLSFRTIMSKRTINDSDENYLIVYDSVNDRYTWAVDNSTSRLDTSAASISANNWYLLHGTFDGSTLRVYRDASEVSNSASSNTSWLTNSQILAVGSDTNANREFDGELDELRITDNTLSANWITTEYNNQSDTSTFYTVGSQETNGGGSTRRFFLVD